MPDTQSPAQPDSDIRALAADLSRRLAAVPEGRRDEYEALVCAALDETGGDLARSMDLADELLGENP